MNRLLIVAATREDSQGFLRNTELGLSLHPLLRDSRIIPRIAFRNRQGIGAIFNYTIQQAEEDDLILFTHDDVYLEDFYVLQRLQDACHDLDVVGVAGNSVPDERHVDWSCWRNPETGDRQPYDAAHLSGGLARITPEGRILSLFGSASNECILLDRCFLAARAKTLHNRQIRFDTRFEFHFYAEDFCRTCRAAGLRIGTWPIAITHASNQPLGGPEWQEAFKLYQWKWGNVKIGDEKTVFEPETPATPLTDGADDPVVAVRKDSAALVIRRMAMGDVIFAEPVIRALKKAGYERVYFQTHYPEVMEYHPDIEAGSPASKCDVYALDGVYETKPDILVQDAYLGRYDLRLEEDEKLPRLWLTAEEKRWARDLLGNGKWVALDIGYPGGRLWWPPEAWAPVEQFLHSEGFKIVQVGAIPESMAVRPIDLSLLGKTDRRQLMAVIAECHSMIGIDSGPINIAQAFGVPGIGIYWQRHPPRCRLAEGASITPLICEPRERLDASKINTMFRTFCHPHGTKGGVEMPRDKEFVSTINRLIEAFAIEEIVETGTYRGTGSTRVFAETGLPVQSIECNKAFWETAVQNLEKFPNVKVHHGYSLQKAAMLDALSRDKFDGKRMNLLQDVESRAGDFYRREIDHGELPENLLVEMLGDKPQIVFLDSAGGLGWLEFKAVFARTKRNRVILVMDDIGHVKHYRSAQRLLQLGFDFHVSMSGRWGWAPL